MRETRNRWAAGLIAALLLQGVGWTTPSRGDDVPAAVNDALAPPAEEPAGPVPPPDTPVAAADEAAAPDTEDGAPDEPAAPEEDGAPDEAGALDEPAAAAAEPAPTARPDRVRVKLDVSGEIFAPAGRDAPPLRLATNLDAMFDFVEVPLAGAAAGPPPVERRYADAVADLRIDGASRRIALAPEARVVRVELRGTTPSPYLEHGFLTRDELDLLEMPFDPLLTTALRPGRDVAVGESWTVSADAAAGLLAIDTLESGAVEARLDEVVDGLAVVAITGMADGAADGVPTHVAVEGSCRLPARAASDGRYTLDEPPRSAAVTIRERREAGHVAPGFDVEARMSFARSALGSSEPPAQPADVPGDVAPQREGPGRPGLVWHRDALGRFELVHETGWRTIEDGPDGLVLRLVDHGALVAQCSVTALPRASGATPPTIAEVERDLARSLAGQFGAVEHSSESTRTDGVRIVRVVAGGRAGDLPFRWIHAVLTDGEGHRVAVTCLLEASLAERFGDADRRLVDGIRLPAAPGTTPDAAGDREARLPQDSRTP